mgnify:CR=1 FL=1
MEPRRQLSRADYLALSETWDVRQEWVNGEAYAMAGGTRRHAAVAMNVALALGNGLRGRPCRPFNSDQRIFVEPTDAFLYADTGVVCGPFEHPEGDTWSVTNPVVIVEVLSASTRDYDQGAKFDHYRRLPSLEHYVLVDPESPHIIHHRRHGRGWLRHDHESGSVALDAVGVSLDLDTVYADLDGV